MNIYGQFNYLLRLEGMSCHNVDSRHYQNMVIIQFICLQKNFWQENIAFLRKHIYSSLNPRGSWSRLYHAVGMMEMLDE